MTTSMLGSSSTSAGSVVSRSSRTLSGRRLPRSFTRMREQRVRGQTFFVAVADDEPRLEAGQELLPERDHVFDGGAVQIQHGGFGGGAIGTDVGAEGAQQLPVPVAAVPAAQQRRQVLDH